jgi:hypothetical protein
MAVRTKKRAALRKLHLKGFVLRQTLCRASTGQDQHFGTVSNSRRGSRSANG